MAPAAKGVRFSGGELCKAEAPTEPAGETRRPLEPCKPFEKGLSENFIFAQPLYVMLKTISL